MMRPLYPSLALFAGLLGPLLYGADSAAKPPPLKVTVSDVLEIRGTAPKASECRLTLNLLGDAAADAHSVFRIRVLKASDESGRDLMLPNGGTPEPVRPSVPAFSPNAATEQRRLDAVAGEVARRRAIREAQGNAPMPPATPMPPLATPPPSPGAAAKPTIVLRSPSRQSSVIKLVEGEVEFFAPTAANGGLVQVESAGAKPGEFLASGALTSAGVRMMYLTPESYDAQRKALKADGKDMIDPWSDTFATRFGAFARLGASPRQPPALFYVHDPKGQVVSFELQDANGKRLDLGEWSTGASDLRVLNVGFDGPIPPTARLVVRLAVPGALVTHPFKLEDIPLP